MCNVNLLPTIGVGRSLEEEDKRLMRDVVEARKARRQLEMAGESETSAAAIELKRKEDEAQERLMEVRNKRALAKAERLKLVVPPPLKPYPPPHKLYGQWQSKVSTGSVPNQSS